MGDYSTYVGLDVHARPVEAQALRRGTGGRSAGSFSGEGATAAGLAGWLSGLPRPAYCAYESGVTGFHLARGLRALGFACDVVAVSTLPRSPKDRQQKCDRRDARALLREISNDGSTHTVVAVPDERVEGARDVVRAHRCAQGRARQAAQRLSMFLMRNGHVWNEKTRTGRPRKPSGRPYEAWLDSISFADPSQQAVYEAYRRQLRDAREEAAEMGRLVAELAGSPEWRPYVDALRCLKGLDTATAMLAAAEFGDFSRFRSGRRVSAWAGLVPSDRSSGERASHGPSTGAGNKYLRSALVEGLSAASRWSAGGKAVPKGAVVSPAVAEAAARANRRLRDRYVHLRDDNGLCANKAKLAVAGEMVRWVWAIGLQVQRELAARAAPALG